ncbi:NlpC/P60 family protein [Cryobacterium melibiosiphilum]|uniref:NlpC/P60 family protein n=1 Tax=Cryobacterium melibiosiphilum TaxID=995039 RepID=A0A3A5MH12_9MICO|nr:NlpC/P60 family protein [Cryobacterium melibiosiphilum]
MRHAVRPVTVFSAVAVSAVVATFGLTVPAAVADEDYPSWTDVEQAKLNEDTKQAEIENLTELLVGLQTTAADAATASQIAAEAYRITQDDLDAAAERETSLTAQAQAAQATADTSKLRAGLIAAHLAKTGAQSLSLNLFMNSNGADDLLGQLGTASKLSEQSERIYAEASQDANTAESLADQAASAAVERERLTEESAARFDEASAAAAITQTALETEQRKSQELYEQLALLKDTTAEAERSYQTGLDAAAAARAFAAAQAAAAQIAAQVAQPQAPTEPSGSGSSGSGSSGSGNTGSGNTGSGSGGSSGAGEAAAPEASVPAESVPAPTVPETSVPAPSASAVSTALSFARAQLGDRYRFGGAGPDEWDCSGLTKAAYAAAGIYIGTHSATNQYNTLAGQGKLVSFANVQVGDLLFWGSPGNYYHTAIYVGGGQILEAPNPSQRVRVHSIWSIGAVAPYVGRPSA